MKTDIQIAQECVMKPIEEVAAKFGITRDNLELYGDYKAKINYNILKNYENKPDGKLILVTAMTPTPAGEGKTTVTVGLGDALSKLGKKTAIALREPSLGPVFGVKGGAAGGGYAQVVPMEDINLHFTGDIHAIGAANNLLAAMIDNHIQQGNALGIDVRKITWKRCVDMNDRQLRNITCGLGGVAHGVPRQDGFDITVASEVMATLCLSRDILDLKEKLGKIIIGYTRDDTPVTAAELGANGAMAALLKDALKPNLVQTLEHTPAFVHGGPFANIAHGCNSLMATRMALKFGDYAVTESGFGADLGAEKFIDIKCRIGGLIPAAAVIVATVRALKHHGGGNLADGMPNLLRHIENIRNFDIPAVVAINRFPTDTDDEHKLIIAQCAKLGVKAVVCEVHARGGAGGEELAKTVVELANNNANPNIEFAYDVRMPIHDKIEAIVQKIYRGIDVAFTTAAEKDIARLEKLGFGELPICMAKTQYSFSDDASKLCAPTGFTVTVRNVRISAGAGFVVALTGDIMTIPGLPKSPSAERIDVDESGRISGLF
ncbi:MAG: formate--tetrahydrofolate ligase [Oscillospiraceae bacterium]|nr:formate--tetrahydrofolate ligase [Oscillospiraceae bacterium]